MRQRPLEAGIAQDARHRGGADLPPSPQLGILAGGGGNERLGVALHRPHALAGIAAFDLRLAVAVFALQWEMGFVTPIGLVFDIRQQFAHLWQCLATAGLPVFSDWRWRAGQFLFVRERLHIVRRRHHSRE